MSIFKALRSGLPLIRALRAMKASRVVAICLLLFVPLSLSLPAEAQAGRLERVPAFGTNAGQLLMFKYVPRDLEPGRPLVVALHGCTQKASDYDDETGWVMLAERLRFALLLPEQQPANNDRRCFNWFLPGDNERGKGEAHTIKEMVEKMKADHGSHPQRIFVTGLSGGGAMTAVMLAAYPDLFAGGGIIAGIPYKCANTLVEALTQCGVFGGAMRDLSPRQWGDLVRAASPHPGPYPRLSIWHGSDDVTVKPKDMQELMEQWTDLHGIDQTAEISETLKGHVQHQVFEDGNGRALVETFLVGGMKHGTPIDPGPAEDQCGVRPHAEHILEAGICSSFRIARFWGLDNQPPSISISSAAVDGRSITINGAATDGDGFIAKVSVALDGAQPQAEKDASGTSDWSARFDKLPDNTRYIPVVTARDDQGAQTTIRASTALVVGNVSPNMPPNVRIDAVDVQRACVTVEGQASDPDPDSAVARVEVALGTRAFKAATLDEQRYTFTECGLAAGTYAVRARAVDSLGASSAVVTGPAATVERQVESVVAHWLDHMRAGRINVYRAPCRPGFGTCDQAFSTIFLRHGSNPFALFKGLRLDAWFVDENAAKEN